MVIELAGQAGISADSLYFNIDRVGNISAASIPIAIHDAVTDGVIDRPMRIFAPGFGAGAIAGYAVLRIDPAIIVPECAGARRTRRRGATAAARSPRRWTTCSRPSADASAARRPAGHGYRSEKLRSTARRASRWASVRPGSARMAASADPGSGAAPALGGRSSSSRPACARRVSGGMPSARATWVTTLIEGWCRPRSSWLRYAFETSLKPASSRSESFASLR